MKDIITKILKDYDLIDMKVEKDLYVPVVEDILLFIENNKDTIEIELLADSIQFSFMCRQNKFIKCSECYYIAEDILLEGGLI